MKKLFLTAIALVAFNGVSMANTIGEKNVISEEDNNEKQLDSTEESTPSCALQYLADFKRLEDAGVIFEVAGAIAFKNYKTCSGLD
jgi:hypothetical protein